MIFSLILFFGGATLIFLGLSLRVVPSDPPSVALVTFLGKRTNGIRKEGIRVFPFAYFGVYDGIVFNVAKVSQDMTQRVRTGADSAEMHLRLVVTWRPDETKLDVFQNHGGESGMRTIMEGKIFESLRQWAISSAQSWKSVLEINHEVTDFLIRRIAAVGAEETGAIGSVSNGVGELSIPDLGIILNRLSIATIDPGRNLAETADLAVSQKQVMAAEVVRVTGYAERIKQLTAESGLNDEQAQELLQMERGYAQKKIIDLQDLGVLTPGQAAATQKIIGS